MNLKIAVINDIHFGIKESKRLFEELHQFTDYISENPIDAVVFAGDYFDAKLSVGDLATFYAMSFFQQVFNICKSKNIPIRMIQGTRSHDLNQLSLFEPFTHEKDVDFKIYETVKVENLLGLNILFVPEEYPENFEEYYADYKKEKFNIIFGHGTWDFLSFGAEKKEKPRGVRSAPVFVFDDWKDAIGDGLVVFGHIHGRNIFEEKVYYPGSFTRWSYGERGDRGFSVVDYDLESNTWKVEMINNTEAPEFNATSVKELAENLDELSASDIVSLIKANISGDNHLRVDLSGISNDKIDIIKKALEENQNIKLEVREARTLLRESSDSEKFKKFEYITKRQLPLNKTIQRFCKEELSTDLTLEVIDAIISK
jgi:DNA repair exonuclease SbcCD nuclease subunit